MTGRLLSYLRADDVSVGQSTFPRMLTNSAAAGTGGTQNLRLTYFTAMKSLTTTQVRTWTGSTAAGATPTLVRWGLYTVDASGNGTLVASTPNDTALLNAAFTASTKAWSSPYSMIYGQRYALGLLINSAAAFPTLTAYSSPNATIGTHAPRLAGAISGQADLPASFLAGSVASSGLRKYAEFL